MEAGQSSPVIKNNKLGYLRIIRFNLLAMAISMVWGLNIVFMPVFVTGRIAVSAFKIGFLASIGALVSLAHILRNFFTDRSPRSFL